MDLVELTSRLHFLRSPVGHVYLWVDDDGLTLVDSGIPGSAPAIEQAVTGLGYGTGDVRRLVLTHFHGDHAGAAADVAGWNGVEVYAHEADAPFLRGERSGPEPRLLDWERPLFEQVTKNAPPAAPDSVRVDHELRDGDVIEFGGGARVISVPGHTPGSIALHLTEHGVLFTGDTIARSPDGDVMLGVFNADPEQAAASMRRQADLDVDIACFGHGEPLTANASAALRAAAARLP